MSDLDPILHRLAEHEGVEHVLLVGRDGLLIRQADRGGLPDVDTVAALLPSVASACAELARATGKGDLSTAVLELEAGVAIVVSISEELFLTVLVRSGVGFAPVLREARRQRAYLATLL